MIIYVILNEKYSLKPTRSSKYQNYEVRTGVEKHIFVISSTTGDAKLGNLCGVKDFTNCVKCINCPGAFSHNQQSCM